MDIKIEVDDFSICKYEGEDDEGYDLCFIDRDRSLERLVRRALETPFSYIGRQVIDSNGSYSHDYTFGNPIYSRLSEAITLNLLSSIRQDSEVALTHIKQPDLSILNIEVINSNFYTVDVRVDYIINGTNQTTQATINL